MGGVSIATGVVATGGSGMTPWSGTTTYQPGQYVLGPLPSSYTGLVATGGLIPFWLSASTQMGSRKRHTATTALTTFKLLFPNFTGFDTPTGGTLTLTASVEYPVGVFTQVKFAGSATGSIPNGSTLLSDDVTVAIPAGSNFYVRTYGTNPGGVIAARMTNGNDFDFGEARESGTSGITDKTMGGTYTNSFPGYIYGPMAIVGPTTGPSVFVLGSSTSGGFNNQGGLPYGPDNGTITPSLAPTIANTLLSAYNQSAAQANAASNLIPSTLGPYLTHVIGAIGQNDIRNGDSAATVLTALNNVKTKYASGKIFFGQTFGPDTTSSDGWTTSGGQTPSASNAQRIAYNNLVRAGVSGWAGYFEIADVWETARNSGIWKTPNWTDDGLHGTLTAYSAIKDGNVVDPTRIVVAPSQRFTMYKMIGSTAYQSSTPPYSDPTHWLALG